MRVLLSAGLFFLFLAQSSPALAGDFHVLSSDHERILVEFRLGDYEVEEVLVEGHPYHRIVASAPTTTADAGAPMLPLFTTTLGIPSGAQATLRVLETDVERVDGITALPFPEQWVTPADGDQGLATPVAEYVPDDALYARTAPYPALIATLGEPGRMRNQAVIPLRIVPIRARGGFGPGLLVARRVLVEIRFTEPRTATGEAWAPVGEERWFENHYRREILNYADARRWRARRAEPLPARQRLGRMQAANPEVKIRINDNEIVRVSYSALASVGWTATPPIGELELTTRDYDASVLPDGDPFVRTPIAIQVTDANTDGVFNAGDSFVFYGQDARTQRGWVPPQDRYSWENVYWLTWVSGGGAVMATRDGSTSGGAAIEPTDFEYWERLEEQNFYYWYAVDGDDIQNLRQAQDHVYFTDRSYTQTELQIGQRIPFDVWDPVADSPFGLRVQWQAIGISTNQTFTPSVYIGIGTSRGTVLPGAPLTVTGDRRYTYDSNGLGLGPEYIGHQAGRNVHELVTELDSGQLSLNWFEIGYRRRYVADGDDQLKFTNGDATGLVRYTVSGFGSESLLVLDLADPDLPVRITGGDVSGGGNATLVFEDQVSGDSRYLAQTMAAIHTVAGSDMELDEPSNLSDTGAGNRMLHADYLIVTYDDFADELDDLVAWRESQGHVVEVARISDVYDEFSGGLFRPDAIREYVRWAYRKRPGRGGVQPLFLLLVGDGSEDYYQVSERSGQVVAMPSFVPVYTVLGAVSDDPRKPFSVSDHWYIANPDGDDSGDRFWSSMMVGRLPAGSELEVETVVEKILTYEQGFDDTEDQTWRRRGLKIADDCYSGALGASGGAYRGRTSERAFETTSISAIDTIRAAGFEDFEVDTFFISAYLDTIPYMDRDGSCTDIPDCGWPCSRRYSRNVENLDGKLIDELNRGQLFVTYQGHGNRSLIAHEWILMGNGFVAGDPGQTGDGVVNDVENRFTNGDKIPVWFAYACHVAEMASREEGREDLGDCLAERLVLHRGGGAVAVVASTGFEWLTSNRPVHLATFQAWFTRPDAADSLSGESGTLLGEIMLGAKNLLAATGIPTYENMVESYLTLGDPALRIDIAPPRLKVWQDAATDSPWEEDPVPDPLLSGSPLKVSDADADSASFAARIIDEVPIAEAEVRIGTRDVGAATIDWLPPSAYTLIPSVLPPDPVNTEYRSYILRMTAPVVAKDYDIVFEATDYNRRVMQTVLEARVAVRFYEVQEGGGARELLDGAFLEPGSQIRVVVEAPRGLVADDLDIAINGNVLENGVIRTPVTGEGGRQGERSFMWELETQLTDDAFVLDGSNAFALQWMADDGIHSKGVTVTSQSEFRLDRQFAFPNPFDGETAVFYRVTRAPREASVKIYTLSGRLIRTLRQPIPTVDLNRIPWDGRDEDGDHVANGVYFYRLELVTPDGTSLTEQGKMARVAGQVSIP